MAIKIVVPVKRVAVLDEEFRLLEDGSRVDPDGLDWDLNEWDAFALEAAVQLRDASADGGEVVAVMVGDEEAEEGLLGALARGADRGMRVWDEGLEGVDALAVARVLTGVVGRESPDLVLCGVQSSDSADGAVGVALAGYLGMAHVAVVKGIERDGQQLSVERELEGGLVEVIGLSLPALLTVQTGINEPRYATLRAIKQAREKPLAVCSLGDLALDASVVEGAAGARRRGLSLPERREGAEMLGGSPAEVAARIAEIVRDRVG